MSSWFTGGPYSVLSLLLVWPVSRDVGIGVKSEVVQTAMSEPRPFCCGGLQSLTQDGDLVIGGLFNLRDMHPAIETLTKLPLYNPCTGLKLASLRYMYAMVFTVDEINCNTMLLLDVSYHIVDGFGGSWSTLHGVLSLVGGDRDKYNSTALVPHSALSEQLKGGNSAPLVISHVSSSTSVILSLTLSPLSVPVVPTSVCSESCPPGTGVARRKREHVFCFDCIPYTEGEISNVTGSLYCERCPFEFWSDPERPPCILSFKETLGITLTAVAVAGAVVTVFVVFLYIRHTPLVRLNEYRRHYPTTHLNHHRFSDCFCTDYFKVRANDSELSFLFLLPLKLCFVCLLVIIGLPSVWSCQFQQAAFGTSFVLCVSCLIVKTIVVLVAFSSTRPGAGDVMKWFDQQSESVFLFTSIQVIIYIPWVSISPPAHGLGVKGSKMNLECAIKSVVGFALVLGCIGLLARWPSYVYCWPSTFSMLLCCAVWMANIVPAYVSCPGKYSVSVEMFAILASSYGQLICIFTPKCFILLLRHERNTKKHILSSLESL